MVLVTQAEKSTLKSLLSKEIRLWHWGKGVEQRFLDSLLREDDFEATFIVNNTQIYSATS